MSRIFGKVCQNGYVVRDIEAALAHWTRILGVGPFFYIERVPLDCQEGQIGGPQGRFVYFETEAHPGTVIELSDTSGAKGAFFAQIRKAAAEWDGADPIRVIRPSPSRS